MRAAISGQAYSGLINAGEIGDCVKSKSARPPRSATTCPCASRAENPRALMARYTSPFSSSTEKTAEPRSTSGSSASSWRYARWDATNDGRANASMRAGTAAHPTRAARS